MRSGWSKSGKCRADECGNRSVDGWVSQVMGSVGKVSGHLMGSIKMAGLKNREKVHG